jgi:acyl-CoA reductase-like NAD-dependent aldehyde dehydrogenase
LADAIRFLEREAPRLLRVRRLGRRGRPAWLSGVEAEIVREPLGTVLVIGPSNYPLFLPGVQALQALAAGNDVLWKPGAGGTAAATMIEGWLRDAGLPPGVLRVLPEDPESARSAIDEEADLVVLTGSAVTAREVLARCASRLVPAIVEASGCDAVFVLEDADLDRVAACVAFGLGWNGAATCIAPKRVFVPARSLAALEERLVAALGRAGTVAAEPRAVALGVECAREAVASGARLLHGELRVVARFRPVLLSDASPSMRLLREDVFAPFLSLVPVASAEEAIEADARCPYALGASIFGDERRARAIAHRIRAGSVTINDLIVPTADPRLPFGGRGRSGFGKTRGDEGLLAMTTSKTISVRKSRTLRHLTPPGDREERIFRAWLGAAHGRGLTRRLRAIAGIVKESAR